MSIAEANLKDIVAEVMSRMKSAIEEEQYHDALRLCKDTGSGLVGWWVGCSNNSDDPFGRLVHISPGVGRFIGRSYTPRQLVTASTGTPLFEIFVTKDVDGAYQMQVVYLQRAKKDSSGKSASSVLKTMKGFSTSGTGNAAALDIVVNENTAGESEKKHIDIDKSEEKRLDIDKSEKNVDLDKSEKNVDIAKSVEKGLTIEGATEEGIRSVINFLKDKIPGLKVKVMNVDVVKEDRKNSDSVKQLKREDDDKTKPKETSDSNDSNLDAIQPDRVAHEEDNSTTEDKKISDMKLFIGDVLHNEDTATKDDYVRIPAEVKDMKKDSFVLHLSGRNHDKDSKENKLSKFTMAAIAAQGVSDLMPSDVAKALLNADKVSSKVTRDMREIVKFAISQAQKWNELSEYTTFCRITTATGNADPFDGLYVGAFGPYGTEVVQLRRKFGYWNGSADIEKSSNAEFFEYVEAVKLTGDLNVPAGQVTFRAKIGKGNRNTNRGMYPDELGVVSSYKGQGRIAEFGFRNPQWVDGELLQLNGKGMGPYVRGADIGFLYVVPEQSFLVLFNRLKLPN